MEDLFYSYVEASRTVNYRRRQLKQEQMKCGADRPLQQRIDVLTEEYNDLRKVISLLKRYVEARPCRNDR